MSIFYTYSFLELLFIFTGAFIIGLAKAGLKGIDMLNVTLMALVFGGKVSTGIVLPLLCIGDLAAVVYYHRHAKWEHFWKLIPWIILGIVIGVITGKEMDENVFRKIMAMIIIVTVMIMIGLEFTNKIKIPDSPVFAATTGVISGITTMLGNLAGAFANLYFLTMRMPKNDFIGTAAWLFLIINLFKIPFQVFYWQNITLNSIKIDLVLLPALVVGFWLGLAVVKIIKDDHYRKIVIALTMIGALMIFMKK